jgi:hypothetical protein
MLRKSLSTWRVAEKPVPIEAAEVHLLVENLLKTAKEKQKVYEKKEDAKKSFEALIEVLSSIEETIKSEILVRDLEEWNYDIRVSLVNIIYSSRFVRNCQTSMLRRDLTEYLFLQYQLLYLIMILSIYQQNNRILSYFTFSAGLINHPKVLHD